MTDCFQDSENDPSRWDVTGMMIRMLVAIPRSDFSIVKFCI